MNEHRRNTVILSAWVDPVLRDYAREAAKAAGMPFSAWVGRAVQQALSRESAEREDVALKLLDLEGTIANLERQVRHCERNHVDCETCGSSHCECDDP